jgi:hypothetical protein
MVLPLSVYVVELVLFAAIFYRLVNAPEPASLFWEVLLVAFIAQTTLSLAHRILYWMLYQRT